MNRDAAYTVVFDLPSTRIADEPWHTAIQQAQQHVAEMIHLSILFELAAFFLAVLNMFFTSTASRYIGCMLCVIGIGLAIYQLSKKRSLLLQPFVILLFGVMGYMYIRWER